MSGKKNKRGMTIATRSGEGAVINSGKPPKKEPPAQARATGSPPRGTVAVPAHPAPDTIPPPHRG